MLSYPACKVGRGTAFISLNSDVTMLIVHDESLSEGNRLLYNHFLPNNTAPCWFQTT